MLVMDIAKYQSLLEEGYKLCPWNAADVEQASGYQLFDVNSDTLRDYLFGRFDFLGNADRALVQLYRFEEPYHIVPEDLLSFLTANEEDQEAIDDMLERLNSPVLECPCFDIAVNAREFTDDDYLFNDPHHICVFVLTLLQYRFDLKRIYRIHDYIDFLLETSEQLEIPYEERRLSDSTKALILFNLSECLAKATHEGREAGQEQLDFYRDNLLELAKRDDYSSVRLLGYEYYEGTNGFPLDPNESLYWLERAYRIGKDPEIARTLGYIYYYGRANDGVPQEDEAFRYFAIGHIAGGYFEATCKLADCYTHGYGTPVSDEAAYRLVSSIYEKTLDYFLEGEFLGKFADVALRLGSYYRDGVYVGQDFDIAYDYFLQARAAIHERLRRYEYVGDRSVSASIARSISGLENKSFMGDYLRPCVDGYYYTNDPEFDFYCPVIKVERIDMGRIRIYSVGEAEKGALFFARDLGFCERITRLDLYCDLSLSEEEAEALEKKVFYQASFDEDGLVLYGDEDFEGVDLEVVGVSFAPETIKNPEKLYTVVSVQFDNSARTYDYLCEKPDVKEEDELTVETKNGPAKVVVSEVRQCYEDQLPLPLNKMAVAK